MYDNLYLPEDPARWHGLTEDDLRAQGWRPAGVVQITTAGAGMPSMSRQIHYTRPRSAAALPEGVVRLKHMSAGEIRASLGVLYGGLPL